MTAAPGQVAGCPFCAGAGGRVVFEAPKFRVVHAQEAGFPAFYRLVWNTHAAEFSELTQADRALCIEAVTAVEQALREVLAPTKVNLAALGNMVAHLHWHVVARFDWDSHFPGAVWAAAQREAPGEAVARVQALLAPVEEAMVRRLGLLG